MKEPGAGHDRAACLSGAGFVLLSVLAVVLSLGAPGLGWGLATITMNAVSVFSREVSRYAPGICLVVTALHLFTLGPMAGGAVSSDNDWFVAAAFAVLPFIAGTGALVIGCLRTTR